MSKHIRMLLALALLLGILAACVPAPTPEVVEKVVGARLASLRGNFGFISTRLAIFGKLGQRYGDLSIPTRHRGLVSD